MATIVLLPGLGGSGADHWQSAWEKGRGECHVVQQLDWERPTLETWLSGLEAELESLPGPFVIVAHSLGCALAARWLTGPASEVRRALTSRVKAVMMVAAADVDDTDRTPVAVRTFAPMPLESLPCDSLVVVSTNDPYVSVERARSFARSWGSRIIEIGARGHINAASGLGEWPEGWKMAQSLLSGSL